jgi:O-succinylhomoserine sulfhydrylase
MHNETTVIRNQIPRTQFAEHSEALYLSSSFVFESAEHMRATFAEENDSLIYSRFTNPSTAALVDAMCGLEDVESGIATASGMAAVFASIMGLLQAGDHIVASRSVFGSTHALLTQYLPRWGITHTYVDGTVNQQWQDAIEPTTKMFLCETPSNPGLDIVDLSFVGNLANSKNIWLNVDNCFATPYLQKPANYGAHIITHSATKWIDGQGRVLGGLVLGNKDLIRQIYLFARNTGPSLSAFNAWILSKSLETLKIRLQHHCASALAVATAIEGHNRLDFVRYPWLESFPQYQLAKHQMSAGGGIITLQVKGNLRDAQQFVDRLQLASITANVGDTRTIVTHPATSTHSKLTPEARALVGISDTLVRMSIGLEHPQDIIADVMQALS